MSGREALKQQVLDELAAHTPPRLMDHLRRWPTGPLSLVHLHVLMVLDEEGPLPMRALAESLDVSQASATGIVDRMEQRGLAERRRDDEDRRVIRVGLTAPGRELIGTVATERRERLAMLLDELTEEELEGFLRGSAALRRARERLHEKLARGDATRDGHALDPHAASGSTVHVPGPHQPDIHAHRTRGETSR